MQTPTNQVSATPYTPGSWPASSRSPERAETWYLPAYNPHTHELLIVEDKDGIKVPTIRERVEVLDYEKHKISTPFGHLTRPDPNKPCFLKSLEETLDKRADAAAVISQESSDQNKGDTYTPTVNDSVAWIATSCLNSAWYDASLKLFEHSGETPDVFRTYATIIKPVITNRDEMNFVTKLGESATFIELREKLKAAKSEKDVTLELYSVINQAMTETVNRVIRKNLSIPELFIESFVQDIEDLQLYLVERYGQTVSDALKRKQREIIRSMFVQPGDEVVDSMFKESFDKQAFCEGNRPHVNYLCSEYTLSLLNCEASDLEVSVDGQTASNVTSELAPALYKLLHALFEETKDRNFHRHLLNTRDGVILEASRGFLGDGCYLLSVA